MKFLIWLGCIFTYSAIVVLLGYAGLQLGGIPIAILFAVFVFVLPKIFFKKYDTYREAKEQHKDLDRQCEQLNTVSSTASTPPHSETTSTQEPFPKKSVEATVNSVANTNNQRAQKKVRVHIKKDEDENVTSGKAFENSPRKHKTSIIVLSCLVAVFLAVGAYLGYCAYTYYSLLQEYYQTTEDLIDYIEDLEEEYTKLESEIREIERPSGNENTGDSKYAHKEGFLFGYKKGYIEAYEAAMKEAGAIYKDTSYAKFSERQDAIERAEVNAEHYANQRFEDFLNFFQHHGLQ